MSGNTFGTLFCVTSFGESHGPAIGCVVDGCPPGLALSEADIQRELDRRKPGTSRHVTQRRESDTVEILSGVFEGATTGTPIGLVIRNEDARSRDYANIADTFRPGHADYTYWHKYGTRDYRGGGRQSARETAVRVAAGAVARKWLRERYGVEIRGHMRDELNVTAVRRMAVLDPIKLVIENYPEGEVEECFAPNHPQQPDLGRRAVPLTRELWIEREDFAETPPKGYFRLSPGTEVRLRHGYIVRCTGFDKDDAGNVTTVRCTYDAATRSGTPGADARKVKGNIHWLSAAHAVPAEVRLYDRLFRVPFPGARISDDDAAAIGDGPVPPHADACDTNLLIEFRSFAGMRGEP